MENTFSEHSKKNILKWSLKYNILINGENNTVESIIRDWNGMAFSVVSGWLKRCCRRLCYEGIGNTGLRV
jgi:hypothetical protein